MKKTKNLLLVSILLIIMASLVVLILPGRTLTSNAVNYSFFTKDDIDPSSYAYSMALIGDTQSLVYSDAQNAGVS